MFFMGLFMLVPLVLILGAVWLAAGGYPGWGQRRASDDAAAILRRRLAASEITLEQYEQARVALGLPGGA